MSTDELTLFRAGDAAFVRTLYARQRSRLLTFARHYLHDGDEADDALAETWRLAWEKRDNYRGDGPIEHWLFKICASVCAERLRSRKREAKLLQTTAESLAVADVGSRAAEHAALLMQHVVNTVADAVCDLPPRQRQTVELRIIDKKSTAEVAERMHCAPGTVKANLHKAMKHLAPKTRAAVSTLIAARAVLDAESPDGYL